ncbi:pilus assembly protein PilM [Catenovulum sp. 2E275]|uniref:pilus assembly protein PilM n=1 Tax=Catenovulum sp. 2E275 TaxID=2980497 RepID=UPI0021D35789|nr:pilus assembly protein PilM [Catenovulum sp. 2E275]MCU4675831.1 pilus assembly protein PilM [Catenovulum sp. 2E275]
MFGKLLGKKSSILIGVDIGSYSVKAVLMERQGHDYRLLQFEQEPMPKGLVNDKDIKDIEAVGRVISRLRKKISRQFQDVSVAVSGSTVITKTVFMDASFSDDELATQIEIEADSLIPYPIEEVSIDFERIEAVNTDNKKVKVLVSVARTESVTARVSAMEIAGFNAKVMDVEAYALARAAKLCLPQLPKGSDDEPCIAMVDLGAHITLTSIIKKDQVIYTRDQPFGGDVLTKNIESFYQKSYEEAELEKLSGDLPQNYQAEILGPFQNSIIQQIRRTIQMFTTSTAEQKVDYIILSGGCALIHGLAEQITQELEIPCILAKPFLQMQKGDSLVDSEFNKSNSEYLIATGLAMRSFDLCHI